MTASTKAVWLIMLMITAMLLLLWIYHVSLPRNPSAFILQYFSPQLIARSARYHRLTYLVWAAQIALPLIALCLLLFTARGMAFLRSLPGNGTLPGTVLAGILLYLCLSLLVLPLGIYRGYVLERAWGFSQQSLDGWLLDWLKSQTVNLVLLGCGLIALLWLMRASPRWWWLGGAVIFFLASTLATMLWPLVVDPWFHRFSQLDNPPLEASLRDLAREAGLKVDKILVSDASTRTTRTNAYYTGLKWTRRIVLYDNLLKNHTPAEVRLVVAHEIGHWRHGHLWKGLLLGGLGFLLAFALLGWLLAGLRPGRGALYYPQGTTLVAALLLYSHLAAFLTLPASNYVSRQMEREADAEVLSLTGAAREWLQTQVRISSRNLADFEPDPFVHWLIFTHPSPRERIEQALAAEP